jgi:hypothetical protein
MHRYIYLPTSVPLVHDVLIHVTTAKLLSFTHDQPCDLWKTSPSTARAHTEAQAPMPLFYGGIQRGDSLLVGEPRFSFRGLLGGPFGLSFGDPFEGVRGLRLALTSPVFFSGDARSRGVLRMSCSCRIRERRSESLGENQGSQLLFPGLFVSC